MDAERNLEVMLEEGPRRAGVALPPRLGQAGTALEPVAALSGLRGLFKYASQPMQRFEDARTLSERAVAFRMFGIDYVILFDPGAIEQVLVTQHATFVKDIFNRDLRRVLGAGLVTSEGEVWRRNRKLMAPSFQRTEIAAYGAVMVESARTFIAGLAPGAVFDAHSEMMHVTLGILVRSLFGTEVSRTEDVEGLFERMMLDYHPTAVALRVLLPEWFPLPSRRRIARTRRELDAILHELIAERRARVAREANADARAESDLLGRLMLASDAEGGLSEAALRDEAMTMFLAGHETTALSLTYALRFLALHPQVEGQVRAELASVLGSRLPTMADLPRLRYMRAVLDETLRLYPPAWAMAREPVEDVVVAGIAVPRGTQIIISPWIMHRDERFFPEPLRFWPERWLGESAPPRFAYMPFGAGHRTCIGSHFAVGESMLVLAVILQTAQLELIPQRDLEPMPSITLRPRFPVLMRVRTRLD
jgi:cytochrome P450